jgi:hypothetical protein
MNMNIYYRNQLFQNSELISTIYINKNGEEMPSEFEPDEGDIISPTPPPFTYNWDIYNLSIFNSGGYQRIVSQAVLIPQGSLVINRLENFALAKREEWQILKLFWDGLVAISAPTQEETDQFNAAATEANMPFRFIKPSGEKILL